MNFVNFNNHLTCYSVNSVIQGEIIYIYDIDTIWYPELSYSITEVKSFDLNDAIV